MSVLVGSVWSVRYPLAKFSLLLCYYLDQHLPSILPNGFFRSVPRPVPPVPLVSTNVQKLTNCSGRLVGQVVGSIETVALFFFFFARHCGVLQENTIVSSLSKKRKEELHGFGERETGWTE